MNLLLIISLVALWAASKHPIDILSLAEEIYQHGASVPAEDLSPQISSFVEAVEDSYGSDLTERIARTRISTLLSPSAEPRDNHLEGSTIDDSVNQSPESPPNGTSGADLEEPQEQTLKDDQSDSEDREDTDGVEEIVVAASRIPRPEFDTTPAIGLVTDTEFDVLSGVLNFAEVLKELPKMGDTTFVPDDWAEEIRAVERIVSDEQLSHEFTFGKVQEEVSIKFKFPFISQDVPVTDAVLVLAFGSLRLLLYLHSVCEAMNRIAVTTDENTGIDWIFFHQTKLGLPLGLIWIASPTLIVLLGMVVFKTVQWPIGLPVAFLLSGAAAASFLEILGARRNLSSC